MESLRCALGRVGGLMVSIMGHTGAACRTCAGASLLVLLLTLAACGGSAPDTQAILPGGTSALAGLRITSEALPVGKPGRSYGPVSLEAEGSTDEHLDWHVWDGRLPAGMELTPEGALRGTPQARGVTVFTVHVSDGRRAGVATLAVAIDDLAFYACAGLLAGEAWSGRPVELAVAGAGGRLQFTVLSSPSGGRLVAVDPERGRAVWVPGTGGGRLCTDVLHVRDEASGREREIALPVRPDPTAVHAAEFGRTDVWFVNTNIKTGAHPYATDFQAALAAVGLRGVQSTGAIGRPVDRLAELWVRRALLARLDAFYLRSGEDALPLPVSFPFDEPGPGHAKPARGSSVGAAPYLFNEIAVLYGSIPAVIGTAFIDGAGNGMLENDTTRGTTELGAFVDVVVDYFNVLYDSELRTRPIGPEDEAVLHALLHGLPTIGGRAALLERQGRAFAKVLGAVLAHEVAHSLGLEHTPRRTPSSLMNASAPIEPWSEPAFTAEDIARLRARLPGPGRATAPRDGVSKPGMPHGGVAACDGRTCNLRLPAGFRRLRRRAAATAHATR